MESLGNKLKNARIEKGLTLEQIHRDTSISLRFLEALEAENFDIFPGESYTAGFLKNYGKYLDLDENKLVSLYRALRIQEQPIPEQLILPKRKPPKFVLPVILILAALGVIGCGIYFISVRETAPVSISENYRSPVQHVMEGNILERRFYINDTILVPLGNEVFKLEIVNLGDAVTIRTPTGNVVLDLTQRANVDLNNDGIPELRITAIDFERSNPDMGVFLRFYLEENAAIDAIMDFSQEVYERARTSGTIISTILPPPNVSAFPSAFPFTLQARFQGYCMFRWEVLHERDRRDRNQRYFQRNDELEIQAQNGIRLWASNAQAARFQVIGGGRTVPVEIGAPGEVVVAEIRWIRDEEGRFRLVLFRLET